MLDFLGLSSEKSLIQKPPKTIGHILKKFCSEPKFFFGCMILRLISINPRPQ